MSRAGTALRAALVLGPDSGPDHPRRPARDRFRARGEAGEVRARDFAEEV